MDDEDYTEKVGALATLSRFRSFQNPSCKITGCDQIVVGTLDGWSSVAD